MPIIDERINQIIVEMQGNAKALCKQTKDTQFEELGGEINQIGKNLLQVRNPLGLEKSIQNIHIVLSTICAKLPEEEMGEACKLLKKVSKESDIETKIRAVSSYKSQSGKVFLTPEFIWGLARVRGAQCNVDFAEALNVVHSIIIVNAPHQLRTASAASGVSECIRLLYKIL